MRSYRRAVRSADTISLHLPVDSATLDANSTATVWNIHAFADFAQWAIRPGDLVTATVNPLVQVKTLTVEASPRESNTANRQVLLGESVSLEPAVAPGIFIAARPKRKRLFEMQFKIPSGGLPRRKPFVWVPDNDSEE